MPRYSKAIFLPITANKGRKKLSIYNRVNLHVAVSESKSLYRFFNRTGQVDSHFYVRKDGVVEQYVDTAYRAFADLDGNDATISIETQGGLRNANTEQWTGAQVKALAELYLWCVETHGIKLQIAKDSKIGSSSHGLSWHRLGIDGNFPKLPNILAGRIQRGGGMYYTKSRGKICPGDAKIKQVEEIFELAKKMKNNEDVEKTSSKPKPASKPKTTTKPKSAPKPKKLKVDGIWGAETTGRAQEVLSTIVDKKVSDQWVGNKQPGLGTGWEWEKNPQHGSMLITKLQLELKKRGFYNREIDGHAGKYTWIGFQRAMGTTPDGEIWKPSPAVAQFQKNLNQNKLWR